MSVAYPKQVFLNKNIYVSIHNTQFAHKSNFTRCKLRV